MAFLVLERQMSPADVLDLTPAQVWFYFEKGQQLRASSRLELVADLTAAAAPAQFKDGVKFQSDHVKTLKAAAGFGA